MSDPKPHHPNQLFKKGLPRDPEWKAKGACAGVGLTDGVNDWWPDEHSGMSHAEKAERDRADAKAKAVCRECPVRAECLEWGLRHEEYGRWGGLDEDERRAIRRERKKEARASA